MNESYEEVVRRWYNTLKPLFQNVLRSEYNSLSSDEIEDLYQDSFIAVYENLQKGTIQEHVTWKSYIIQIGINQASIKMRHKVRTESLDMMFSYDKQDYSLQTNRIDAILHEYANVDESLYKTEEVVKVLGDELQFIPEPCSTIIRLFYYDKMSMDDITVAVNLKNANTTKSKKSQCMKGFVSRVKKTLMVLGLIKKM